MSADDFISEKKKYILVPPDGGWGYMVIVAVIICYVATMGFGACFGIIYHNFFDEIHMTSTALTLIFALQAVVSAVFGFLTGVILKKMSLRHVALISALLFNVGLFCIVFSNSIATFTLCFGFLMSAGYGIIYNLCSTIINDYFIENRILAVNITQTITAILSMAAPTFVRWSTEEFGFRGTVLLTTAVSMHLFIAVFIMQPVKWHMRKIEFSDNITPEIKLLMDDIFVYNTEGRVMENQTAKLNENDTERSASASLDDSNHQNFLNTMRKFLFDSDLKPYILSNASMAPMLCIFSELCFMAMFPQALYSIGWNESRVTLAVSLVASGDLATRVLGIFLDRWLKKIGCTEIYIVGLVIVVIARLGMLWAENVTLMLVFITISGIPRCTITTYMPLVIAEAVPPNKFASAMGLSMLFYGLFNIVLGPIIGAVRDMTNSFMTVFYILTSFNAIVVLFWSIELCYKKNRHKRRTVNKQIITKVK